jgi:hypothetical protein
MIAHFGYKPKKNTGFEWGWTFSCVCFAVPRTCVHDRSTTKFGSAHPQTRLLHFRTSFVAVIRVNLLTNSAGLTNLVGSCCCLVCWWTQKLILLFSSSFKQSTLVELARLGLCQIIILFLKISFRQVSRIFYNIPKIASLFLHNFFFL